MIKERARLCTWYQTIESQIKNYPDGKLICSTHNNKTKWYISNGHTKIYIPKTNLSLAQDLAAKKYLSYLLKDIGHEIMSIDFYLRHHHPLYQKANQLLTETPGYKDLLSPYFMPQSQELYEWANASYEKNPKHPEHLIHKSTSGHLVRSKSESMIASLLHSNKIPFRYECPLILDGHTLYPDFSIRHPRSGVPYYWEHFGLMDDASYCKNATSKIQLYSTNGIIPTINLITTYETKNNPLSIEMIQKIIDHYFL